MRFLITDDIENWFRFGSLLYAKVWVTGDFYYGCNIARKKLWRFYWLSPCSYNNEINLRKLQCLAGEYCRDIFEDFDEIEIQEEAASIRNAWETGRELSALKSEIDAA